MAYCCELGALLVAAAPVVDKRGALALQEIQILGRLGFGLRERVAGVPGGLGRAVAVHGRVGAAPVRVGVIVHSVYILLAPVLPHPPETADTIGQARHD